MVREMSTDYSGDKLYKDIDKAKKHLEDTLSFILDAESGEAKEYKPVDYQDFTTIDTPKEERRKINVGDIYSNSAKCLECGDEIRSKNRHDYVRCSCGNVAIDGGSWYSKVNCNKPDSFEFTTVYYKDVEDE